MQHPMIQSIKELKGYPVDLKNFSTQKGFIVNVFKYAQFMT